MKDRAVLNADLSKGIISKNIYGHFSEHLGRCIYEGIWVGEDSIIAHTNGIRNDVVAALKQINIPVLRWPGGCFADEYHWEDGIGPKENRKRMINTHWGGVVENNHFGTHEFLELCRQLECAPYINGNVGSGTVREMSEWVEYMTFGGQSPQADRRAANGQEEPWAIQYFGIGNENWGCGGQMRPEYYADLYRQFQTYVRSYGDNKIYKIACGPNSADYHWTEVLMREAKCHMNALTLHYYTVPGDDWKNKGAAIGFTEQAWFTTLQKTLFMDELLQKHITIMDQYDPLGKVDLIVDEWGTWYDVEQGTEPGFLYQQNTLRDALVAAINFNLFHKYSKRVKMANIAQMVNVLQAVILTEGEKMIVTPTYHIFDMFKVHHDAELLDLHMDAGTYSYNGETIPAVSASASRAADGTVHISLCHLDHLNSKTITIDIRGWKANSVAGSILTADKLDAHNSFQHAEVVKPVSFEQIALENDQLTVTMPAKSVVVLALR